MLYFSHPSADWHDAAYFILRANTIPGNCIQDIVSVNLGLKTCDYLSIIEIFKIVIGFIVM